MTTWFYWPLLALGLFAVISPRAWWRATRFARSWKYAEGDGEREPSLLYLAATRIFGLVFICAVMVPFSMQITRNTEQREAEQRAQLEREIGGYVRGTWKTNAIGPVISTQGIAGQVAPEDRSPDRIIGYAPMDHQARLMLENAIWYSGEQNKITKVKPESLDGRDLVLGIDLGGCDISALSVAENEQQVVIDMGLSEQRSRAEQITGGDDDQECQKASPAGRRPSFISIDLAAPLGGREVLYADESPIRRVS